MAFFPIPGSAAIPESYVDLRLLWPVKQTMLGDRLIALSPEGRAALLGHFFSFLTARRFVLNTSCPSCGNAIDPAVFLHDVRDE